MTDGFPAHVDRLLSAYRTPALPEGFADRVVAAALAQDGANSNRPQDMRWHRKLLSGANPWKRGRYVASSVAGMALLSTAAAAALTFADIPIRIPVVSDLVEQVLPVSTPAEERAEMAREERAPAASVPETTDAGEQSEGPPLLSKPWREMDRSEKAKVLRKTVERREERIQQRRINRGLEPLTDEQLQRRRAAVRRAVRDGDIPRSQVRRSMRRAVMQEARIERREALANGGVGGPQEGLAIAPEQPAIDPVETDADVLQPESGATTASTQPEPQPQAGDATAGIETQPVQLSPEARARLRERLPDEVKKRLRNATPAERREMLRNLRQRGQRDRNRQEIRKRLRDLRNN